MSLEDIEQAIKDLTGKVKDRLVDYEDRLVIDQSLTADGVQFSTAVATTTADTDVTIFSKTIDPGKNSVADGVLWLEFGLTAAFQAVSTITADLIWKWQARNKGGIWADLHSAVTETNINITYVERTRQGFFKASTIDQVPFEVRLILQCNEANEGRAKVKSSSYVRAVYKPA